MYGDLNARTVRDTRTPTSRLEAVAIACDLLQLLLVAGGDQRVLAALVKAALLGVRELADDRLGGP